MVKCCRCSYEHEVQIVDHIVESHESITDYFAIFSGEQVVSYELKTALENLEIAGRLEPVPGIDEIKDAHRKVLVEHWNRSRTPRSELVVDYGPFNF